MIVYKDFVTGKRRFTRGTFAGWTKPAGFLKVRYAIIKRRCSNLLIPEYSLTPDSRKELP